MVWVWSWLCLSYAHNLYKISHKIWHFRLFLEIIHNSPDSTEIELTKEGQWHVTGTEDNDENSCNSPNHEPQETEGKLSGHGSSWPSSTILNMFNARGFRNCIVKIWGSLSHKLFLLNDCRLGTNSVILGEGRKADYPFFLLCPPSLKYQRIFLEPCTVAWNWHC